jgi:hypothetical protein
MWVLSKVMFQGTLELKMEQLGGFETTLKDDSCLFDRNSNHLLEIQLDVLFF